MTPERAALALVALAALDRADAARAVIAREGMTIPLRPGALMRHRHPLLGIEAASRSEFSRLWMQLGLHRVPFKPSAIEYIGGSSSSKR